MTTGGPTGRGRGRGRLPAPRRPRASTVVVAGLSDGRRAGAVARRPTTPRSPGSSASTPPPRRSPPRSWRWCSEHARRRRRGRSRHRQRHRRPRRHRERLRGRAAPAAAVADRGPAASWPERTRRCTCPLLLLDVAAGPRRRAGAAATTSPRTTAARSSASSLERSYHVATLDFDKQRDLRRRACELRQEGHRRLMLGRRSRARRAARSHRAAVAPRLRADDRPRRGRRGVARRAARWSRPASAPGRTSRPIAVGAVIAGVIGARLYHVITDSPSRGSDPIEASADLAGRPRHPRRLLARRPRRACGWPSGAACPLLAVADAAAPALPLAQAIGRLGQLVEPGAVRPADDAAVGAADRRRAPHPERHHLPARHRSTRRSSTSRCGTSRCAAC